VAIRSLASMNCGQCRVSRSRAEARQSRQRRSFGGGHPRDVERPQCCSAPPSHGSRLCCVHVGRGRLQAGQSNERGREPLCGLLPKRSRPLAFAGTSVWAPTLSKSPGAPTLPASSSWPAGSAHCFAISYVWARPAKAEYRHCSGICLRGSQVGTALGTMPACLRSQCGLTPRSSRPATAGSVSLA
jgi:hypothetical protein